jgi:hypothetical protein
METVNKQLQMKMVMGLQTRDTLEEDISRFLKYPTNLLFFRNKIFLLIMCILYIKPSVYLSFTFHRLYWV